MRARPSSDFLLVGTLGLLLVACSSTEDGAGSTQGTGTTTGSGGGTTATTGAGGAGDGGGGDGPAPHCGPDSVESASLGGQILVKTEHYALTAETDPATAEDFARLLEASWGSFVDYFETAPELEPGERLDVRYFASAEAWSAAIAADGGSVPKNAGGLFLPSTRRAYLYDQHNPYFNQMLLVHEAAHQFHLLGRAKGRNLPFWYVEGLAEHLGHHDWDGRCAHLGTVPLMNWNDLPAEALADAEDGGLDVAAVTSGATSPTRAAAWSVVRYLEAAAPAAQHAGFAEFRAAFDQGSTDPAKTFEALVGAPASLDEPIAAWLPSSQQPMRPIFTEWVHRGPASVLATSPGVFSLSIVKGSATHLEAEYELPAAAAWKVGVVVGFEDPQNFEAIVVGHDGALSSFTATKGQALWGSAGTAPPKTDAEHGRLAVDLAGGAKVTLTVNGATSSRETTFTPKLGLALDDARVLFRALAWQ